MQTNAFRKTAFDLSPEIQSLAEMEELGEWCKVYPVWKPATGLFVGGQVCMAWGVLALVLDALLITATLFSPRPPLWTVIFALAASGLLLLMAGCYLCFSRRIYAHWQVSLWQDGFIYEKKQIRQAFRWNQIERVQGDIVHVHNGPAPILYTYKVRRQDGYEVKLGSVFSDIAELIDVVLEECARHLAPQELSMVPPRSTRTFTALTLDRQGIGNKQETLSWQEIQEFMTKNGTVTLRKKAE
jgi:hypothetical protein